MIRCQFLYDSQLACQKQCLNRPTTSNNRVSNKNMIHSQFLYDSQLACQKQCLNRPTTSNNRVSNKNMIHSQFHIPTYLPIYPSLKQFFAQVGIQAFAFQVFALMVVRYSFLFALTVFALVVFAQVPRHQFLHSTQSFLNKICCRKA